MRNQQCFYCDLAGDEVKYVMIYWMFGLKACPTHKAAAKRDCNAYCHKNTIVDMRHAKKFPVLASLFENLEQETFQVLRTSGLKESGWTLYYGSHTAPAFLSKDPIKGWCIPVIQEEAVLTKTTALSDLTSSVDMRAAIAALDAGVYLDDATAVATLDLEYPDDTDGVVYIIHNGSLCRVLAGS